MRTPRRWMVVTSLLAALSFPYRAATPEQVDEAIKRGQKYLLDQNKKLCWEEVPGPVSDANRSHGDQWSGLTAIATYALLASGENPQSEPMRAAVKLLKASPTDGTYAVGLRAQVWGFLQWKPDVKEAMLRDAKLLMSGMRGKGEGRGLYGYTGKGEDWDHSVAQFGVLGMWACAQLGYETPRSYWAEADAAWRKHQKKDGSWDYNNGGIPPSTTSMTAAGVATLFITQDYLQGAKFAAMQGTVNDPHIESGLTWMGKHFPDVFTGEGGMSLYYTLYGVERIGVAAGRKYLGRHNWFEEGSTWLVAQQNHNGSWGGGPNDTLGQGGNNIASTSFAILFLVRGRAPVIMNKLAYEITPPKGKPAEGLWNQRPRDVANLARWIGKEIERDLNWQSVSLQAPVEELLDAPILYVAGSQALTFSPEELEKLRDYVHRGGIILGNADAGNPIFAKSFTKLGKDLFPDYEFGELPADHPIYTTEQYPQAKWKIKPAVQHLSNGARELMLLIPQADLSRYWQSQSRLGHEEFHELGSDIYLYSVDKQGLQFKGDTYLVNPDPQIHPSKTIKVARLQYPGNWDPEPGGWKRLAAVLHNRAGIDLEVEPVELGHGKLGGKSGGHQVAHLTGTFAWKMTGPAIEEIRAFVNGGGTLIVDAAGGATEFDAAMESNLAALFPEEARARNPIPADHPLFKAFTGQPTPIEWRRYARKLLGNLKTHRLRGINVKNRLAIVSSAEDLSVGLVGQAVDGINGYDPKTATDLMADIILFSTGNAWKPPATQATQSATQPAAK